MKLRRPLRLGLLRLSLLAIVVGIVTGFGAVAFRALIGLIHNIAFLGSFAIDYDASVFTPPSPWGALIILVPVVGGLIVTFLITNYAPEARGHGVPEVMDAIYYREGVIRPVVALIKSLASALSIGTGAAVGREGPIIQIGAALGSTLGQAIRMAPWQRITLVAAGAGAGIAATFNTPIGGVMFAIELMMPELSARTFLPVALATGTATFIGRTFFGIHPAFAIPNALLASQAPATLTALLLYALLGALIGLAAAVFVRGLSYAEDVFELINNPYLRNIVGMLMIGALIYALLVGGGHYYVEGVGYSTIQAILNGDLGIPALLVLLFAAKLCATSVSLASGASGGIFSPSLFMGATLGGAFGLLVNAVMPVADLGITTCAIIGMAAMVGGGTGAAMTAVTMIFEMTRDYDLVMPSIIAVALAIGVRRLISQENIYTIKLVGRGHFVPKALHANMFLVRRARGGHAAGRDRPARRRRLRCVPAPARQRRRLPPRGGDARQSHRRRRARQHQPAARGRAGLQRHPPRRRGAAQFHHCPRERHNVRRRAAHGAPRRHHGGRGQGRRPRAPVRDRRHRLQGAHRRFRRRKH
jgi:CIC family chloride channel protein